MERYRYWELEGGIQLNRYHAEVMGSKTPVIFLPAGGFIGEEGRSLAEALCDDFEVHLLDLPGFGRSEGIKQAVTSEQLADWVNDYVITHRLGPVHVMAHSLGGAISLAFATHYPKQVERLVLLDQGHKAFPPHSAERVWRVRACRPAPERTLSSSRTEARAEAGDESHFGQRVISHYGGAVSDILCADRSSWTTRDRRALHAPAKLGQGGLNLMFGFYHLDIPKLMRSLQVPTLLVFGDFIGLDDKEARLTRSAITELQRHELPITYIRMTGGHFVHWNPAFPIERVRQFLQTEKSSVL